MILPAIAIGLMAKRPVPVITALMALAAAGGEKPDALDVDLGLIRCIRLLTGWHSMPKPCRPTGCSAWMAGIGTIAG